MRFRSAKANGLQVFAVTGVHSVSFGISATATARRGLLGFAVERIDPVEDERYFLPGFKVFGSVIPRPDASTQVSTRDHPVQSLVWDDFTAKPDRAYTYLFHPVRGRPRKLNHNAPPVPVAVRTEPLFSTLVHDVFFNRGVASSQAYTRRFGNRAPDQLPPAQAAQAREWLSRSLDDALLRFIRQCKRDDALLCCFYEFRYAPVAEALRAALDRGVDVQLIVDAKDNGSTSAAGKVTPPFPRDENIAMLQAAGIPMERVLLRSARKSAIAHNKFMLWLKGKRRVPTAVWTGSTNISMGGIHGQTNVGHWLRDGPVAASFQAYWQLLRTDPGAPVGDPEARRKNAELLAAVAALSPAPASIDAIASGTSVLFSPRSGPEVLQRYVQLLDQSRQLACITLAFGIGKDFKAALQQHSPASPLSFLLLEKRDVPAAGKEADFVWINAKHNVYQAWGSFLREPLYQWARETSARALGLNTHVIYVHSKFLLHDPLGDDPIVVTGSANFSTASTNDNDENMLLVRGDRRVADIYFTEFNRLFNHYYFRSVVEATAQRAADADAAAAPPSGDAVQGTLFLAEKADDWLKHYKAGSLKSKRVAIFTGMRGFS